MDTYQQLTTEQLEVLILIEVISKFEEENGYFYKSHVGKRSAVG